MGVGIEPVYSGKAASAISLESWLILLLFIIYFILFFWFVLRQYATVYFCLVQAGLELRGQPASAFQVLSLKAHA